LSEPTKTKKRTPGRKLVDRTKPAPVAVHPVFGEIERAVGSSPLANPTRPRAAERLPAGWTYLTCTVCRTTWERADVPFNFYRDSRRQSGHSSRCKACEKERMATYAKTYYAANREEIIRKNTERARKYAAARKAMTAE
jgi:hypothetical protein